MIDLQDISKWVSRISWPMKALATQTQLANIIGTAFSYNKSLAEVFRRDVNPALLVQAMEKTMIEYSGAKAKKFHNSFSRKAEDLSFRQESYDVAAGVLRSTGGSEKRHPSSPRLEAIEPRRETAQSTIPNVALILQNALAYKLIRQKFEQGAAGSSLSEVQDITNPISPKQLVEG